MKESRKQFIKDGHAAACSEWKAKIEKEFPKLFKETEYKKNDWVFMGDVTMELSKIYDFDNAGDPRVYRIDGIKNVWYLSDVVRPATDKEVKEALIKEAKKRGFKKGVKVVSPYNSDHTRVIASSFRFERGSLVFTCESGWRTYLFVDGKWATIIETITKEEAEKQLGKTIID